VLDALLSSIWMIIVLLSKIRAGQSFNCPAFYKNEILSLYEREKKDHRQGLCCCQEHQGNIMKAQCPANSDLQLVTSF